VANAGDAARKLNEFVDVLKGKMPKPIKKVEATPIEAKVEEKPKKPRARKEEKAVAAPATTG
jgi:hypothetical protein